VFELTPTQDQASYIRAKRQRMGLTQAAFASLLGMKDNGERTIRGWEAGEHLPSPTRFNKIVALPEHAPLRRDLAQPAQFRFIDLFAGIGGIRLAQNGINLPKSLMLPITAKCLLVILPKSTRHRFHRTTYYWAAFPAKHFHKQG